MKLLAALLVVAAAGCRTGAPAEPLTLPPTPPPGPWQVMRDVLVGCATEHGLNGNLSTRIEFDDRGYAMNVLSSYGKTYAACVGTNIVHTKFAQQRNRTYDIAFHNP